MLDRFDRNGLNDLCRQEARQARAELNEVALASLEHIGYNQELLVDKYRIFCVHDFQMTEDMPAEQIEKHLEACSADMIFCGHTHRQCVLRSGHKLLLNPGAVCDGFCALVEITETMQNVNLLSLRLD